MNAKVVPRVCTVLMAATAKEVARLMMAVKTVLMACSRLAKLSAATYMPLPALAISRRMLISP